MLKRKLISVAIGVGTLVGGTSIALADQPYIPLISKGFQHQFWQAVKAGAEQSAKEQNVRIIRGP
jgi:ribose transport system substrate-binding protein